MCGSTNTISVLIPSRVYTLNPLDDVDIQGILSAAVHRWNLENVAPMLTPSPGGLSAAADYHPLMTPSVQKSIVALANGDARTALGLLEQLLQVSPDTNEADIISFLRNSVSTSYDRTGDDRYDMISALHKSVRGSQPNAALYWLARMLTSGEDPLYVCRRMIVCASEDIGLADAKALPLAIATMQACQIVGMPECRINLAHLVCYLSTAEKDTRAYEGYASAEIIAKQTQTLPVPMCMRNAPTKLMQDMGYSKGYHYQPSFSHPVTNQYLPEAIEKETFFRQEGNTEGKIWDEDALRDWEAKENNCNTWSGRSAGGI
jgi:putative ATPase